MGQVTKISWAHATWNPWRGCTKVSAGCDHCYAEAMSVRNPAVLGEWGDDGSRAIAAESYWRLPFRWDQKARDAGEIRRVFSLSLGDWLEDRPELRAPRARMLGIIAQTPNLRWLLLTKRPENFESVLAASISTDLCRTGSMLAAHWINGNPPRNVWVGTSIENQEAQKRLPWLYEIPARIRFVSYEPALGPIDWADSSEWNWPIGPRYLGTDIDRYLDWVIVGGESGSILEARPFDLQWARDTIEFFRDSQTSVFIKQLGRNPIEHDRRLKLRSAAGSDPAEWPPDLRVQEFPEGGGA